MKLNAIWPVVVSVISLAAPSARADVTYDWSYARATGTLVLGQPSPIPGYYLVRSVTLDTLFGINKIPDQGPLVATSFATGAAYDPTTDSFISFVNNTLVEDLGGFIYTGTLTPYDPTGPDSIPYTPAFGFTSTTFLLYVGAGLQDEFPGVYGFDYDGRTVAAETTPIPEPPSSWLYATGLSFLLLVSHRWLDAQG